MRPALFAALFVSLLASAAVSAQTAASPPALLASAASHADAPRTAARLFARVDVGITPDWPAGETQVADYAVQEIEAGTVSGDLYVRWSAFGPHAQTFATVAASASDTGEHGVHVLGLASGLYEVRMRETGTDGTGVTSTPVRV